MIRSGLVILQRRVVTVGIVILIIGTIASVGIVVWARRLLHHDLSEDQTIGTLLLLMGVVSVIHFRVAPLFPRLRRAEVHEKIDYPLFQIEILIELECPLWRSRATAAETPLIADLGHTPPAYVRPSQHTTDRATRTGSCG